MHQQIVDGEHRRRVDRVRFGDRDLVRRYTRAWRKLIGHGVAMPPDPPKRKGAPRAPWKVGSDFGKVVKV